MIDKIQNTLEHKQEGVQSVISYGTGGGMIGFASLADLAHAAQSLGLILGCAVIGVRLMHDLHRYIHWLRHK